jgi:asparagine synthase (glutamine-hydrolysing)
MCGIAGKLYFNSSQAVFEEEIKKMTGELAHRGPDDSGTFINGNIGLGHKRLAIIDLSAAGHEPMSDNTNKIFLTFNGEVYNFQELRKNLEKDGIKLNLEPDAEAVIYLYKKYGTECLNFFKRDVCLCYLG